MEKIVKRSKLPLFIIYFFKDDMEMIIGYELEHYIVIHYYKYCINNSHCDKNYPMFQDRKMHAVHFLPIRPIRTLTSSHCNIG